MENPEQDKLIFEPCYCDQEQGVGFFDGIFIIADSMKNAQYDRIIPPHPEEQVFMCRQMTHRLKPGSLVLDVGTGSGVYAIWAAKHQCKVIAIDIIARSIVLAKDNAKRNKIKIVEGIEKLEEGSIYFFQNDFNHSWKEKYVNFFDIVILSPGYTPSLIDSIVFHAKSGEDGQQCFNNFIEIVPHILKEHGCCIGNQFTPAKSDGNYAISKIQETFNGNCQIFYTDIIEKNVNTEKFYREIHKNFVNDPDIETKIEEISNEYHEFSLIYYEAIKNYLAKCSVQKLKTYQFKEKEWEHRIWSHRMCIEYANSRNFTGVLSLFLEGYNPNISISSTKKIDDNLTLEQKEIWHNSPLSIVSNYIEWRKSWDYDCPKFDFILIDTAPIHDHFQGRKRLYNQVKIFFPPLNIEDEDIKELSSLVLQEYQLVISGIQEAKIPPILHPYFMQMLSDIESKELTFPESTILDKDQSNNIYSLEEEEILKKYTYLFNNAFLKVKSRTNNVDLMSKFNIIADLGFSTTKLYDMATPDLREVIRELNNPTRLPKATEYTAILQENNYSDLIDAINDKSFIQNKKEAYKKIYKILREDIEFITSVMHKAIHSNLSLIFEKFDYFKTKSSKLLGFPLGLQHPPTYIENYQPPESYRGVIWIYGATSETWTLKHEQFLKDIAKLNWILFLDKYSLEQEKYESEKAKTAITERLALLHQLPKDLTALNENLSQYSSKMTEFINKYGSKYPELASELPKFYKPDSLGVTLMFTKAAQDRQLTEMPKDCAEILYGEWNQTTIENFINRVVWTQAKNRALNYPKVKEKGVIYYGVVEIDRMFPKPEFILDRPFKLDSAQGIYPLLLLGLRSAYQHSYLMTLLSDSPSAGEVKIEYINEELIITNTGLPPAKETEAQNQASWEKDLKILEGLTNKWKFHNFGNQYITQCSIYDSEAKYWITKIIKEN